MVVAEFLVGVDRSHADVGGHLELEGVPGKHDLTVEVAEVTAHLAHHHVAGDEGEVGMDGIDRPGAGGVAVDLGKGLGGGDSHVVGSF